MSTVDIATGLSSPRGLAIDPHHGFVYWTGDLRIARTKLVGGNPVETLVPTDNGAADVALDVSNGKIYWTDSNNTQINMGINAGKIRTANLDGTQTQDVVNQNLRHPVALALDVPNSKIYWTDLQGHLDGMGSIQRANLDGSNVESIVPGIDEANGLAIDSIRGKIYWTEGATGKIQRANLDGSGAEDVVSGIISPVTIDVDLSESKIYWTDDQLNIVERANLDGSARETVISGIGRPWGIAVLPEPNSLGLMALACATVFRCRFRRRHSWSRRHRDGTESP